MNLTLQYLFSGHGFGINTNIFETNVINLAVVIAIVISFGGDALRKVLSDRKQTIVDNIASADARVKEIEEKMILASQRLSQAKEKAMEIRQSGLDNAKKEEKACIEWGEQETQRCKDLKEDTIRVKQREAIQSVSERFIHQSVNVALKKVEKRKKDMAKRSFEVWLLRHKTNVLYPTR
jgi:F-type H+-transporting ATPase subunit b